MIQRDVFFGGVTPFQGDRTLRLRSIPADARIVKMTARVVPIGGPDFLQVLSFAADGQAFGATKTSNGNWVEVNFHARRTLANVEGTNLGGATLQVDFGGGAYVNISDTGAFLSPPPDKAFTFTSATGSALPGLAVTKLKLTSKTGAGPNVSKVTVGATPANVSLRFGNLGPFWTHLGDLTAGETTPDAAAILQAFLAQAPIENGYSIVPLILHSDSLTRLGVTVDTEFVSRQSALDPGLTDVVVPYDVSGVPPAQADVLAVRLPRNARVVPERTSARVKGAFAETRVAHGVIGETAGESRVEISPTSAHAQSFVLDDAPVAAVAVDLLVKAVGGSARIGLDVRSDLAGKPDRQSLLTRPAELALDATADGRARWISLPLGEEFRFFPQTTYWLVLQSLTGTAYWSAHPAGGPPPGLQRTEDGGLSWRFATPVPDARAARASGPAGPLAALFRLRSQPKTFQVPIEVEAGREGAVSRVPLDRFAPLGRVDFSPAEEIAQAVGESLALSASAAAPPCPDGEHLANGRFTDWIILTDQMGVPAEWTLGGGTISPLDKLSDSDGDGVTLDGVVREDDASSFAGASLEGFAPARTPAGTSVVPARAPAAMSLSQVVPAAGSCPYELSFRAAASDTGAVGELSWRDSAGTFQRLDTIPIVEGEALVRHRRRVNAPDSAAQAEVRFRVPAGANAELRDVSLRVTADALTNGDLQIVDDGRPVGWTLTPRTAHDVTLTARATLTVVENGGDADVELVQTAAVTGGQHFSFAFDGRVVSAQAPPRIELRFLRADGSSAGPAIVVNVTTEDPLYVPVAGIVPNGSAQADVRVALPRQAAVIVRSVSLELSTTREVPIRFIAHAPGELRVSDLRIAYDRAPVPAPPAPPKGLHAPTPAEEEVSDEPCDDSHCGGCGARNSITNAGRARTPAGRPAVVGACRTCGAPIVKLGGTVPLPHEIERSFPAVGTVFAQPFPTTLTAITGIGAARERQLIRAGIDSFEKLAAASPRDVAGAMRGVAVTGASHFITEARRLVEEQRRVSHKILKAGTPLSGSAGPRTP